MADSILVVLILMFIMFNFVRLLDLIASVRAVLAVATVMGFVPAAMVLPANVNVSPKKIPLGINFSSLGIAFFSLQALATALAVGWTVWNRKSTVVHASQPEFLSLVAIGCLILASAILPLSIEGKYMFYTENVYNGCMAVPWLLCIVSEVWTKLRCIH